MKLGWLTLLILCTSTAVAAPPVRGSIAVQSDLVHAEFEGRPTWDYDLKRAHRAGKTWIDVQLDPVDAASLKEMGAFKSEFVRSVKANPQGPDGKTVVSFELTGDEVESFDYLTDQPSRLVIDFYVTESGLKNKKKAAKKAEPEVAEAESKPTKPVAKGKTRKPAGDALVVAASGLPTSHATGAAAHLMTLDGGDPNYDRFNMKDYEVKEEAILRSKENFYIPFPMLISKNESFEKARLAAPVYEIAPKDDAENKMARLLLTLFQRKSWAVYLKTLGWFREKYPDSRYNDLIAYMTGDVYLARWDENGEADEYERAIQAYQSAVTKYPEAAPAERTSFLIGALALERGNSLEAIRAFNAHIEKYGAKGNFSRDLARMGVGFAMMKLFRTEDAFKAFDEVEKTTPFKELRVESAYRKGDAYVAAKQYNRGIEEYLKALKAYPEGRDQHPGATFNQAESLFQTGSYRQALDTYRDFVKRFPTHEQAPFALTRLGELLEILGADPTRVVGAYLETYFRYGENPKAIVARLRLLSARMKSMKASEIDGATKEILSLARKTELPNIEEFATVLIADGYSGRGDHQKAIDLLSKYYQANPTSPDLEPLKKRIVANIADKFRTEVEGGDFLKGLRTHQKYADTWLKGSERLDTKFFLGRAFEMAGVPVEAEKLYKDVLNRVYAAKGTSEGKSLLLLQHLPSAEALNLRLASVLANRKDYQSAYDQLRLIKQPEKMSDDEQIERVDLAVTLFEKRGDLDSASRYLTELLRTWQGKPELVAAPYLRLAEIEIKQGKKDDAVNSLKKIDLLMKDSGKVPAETHARALETLGDLYLSTGAKDKAIETYADLLSVYEDQRPLASIRYRLGHIQFEKGEIQKAAETWNGFKGAKTEFWKNLAQEQLRNSGWRDDYKKYIKRIPAMESKE